MAEHKNGVSIRIKRVYEHPAADDGCRVLIDRLWPRGLSKDKAALDDWVKDVAPSDELRKWFNHDPELWPEFRRRYRRELDQHSEAVDEIRKLSNSGTLTLLYGAKDEEHNNAVVLAEYLEG